MWIYGLLGLVVGFFAGLLLFKVKSRWCPEHGITKTCAACEKRWYARRTA